MPASPNPLVGVIMGSKTDYEHLAPACEILTHLGVPYEAKVVSAHRTPGPHVRVRRAGGGRAGSW
jgi:5-(carboxyamino)imidazole ribonucleotide mutase